jgi:error-prone DNA polymerase
LLRRHQGPEPDLARIPPEDPKTYDMIRAGDTVGVFQIESRAQMAMLPRLRPRTFHELVVEVRIVRPGPIRCSAPESSRDRPAFGRPGPDPAVERGPGREQTRGEDRADGGRDVGCAAPSAHASGIGRSAGRPRASGIRGSAPPPISRRRAAGGSRAG